MQQVPENDQRRFSRIPFPANVQLYVARDVYLAHLVDIALKGALVELRQPVAGLVGRTCQLKLNLGRGGEAVVMDGMVVHHEGQFVGIECRHIDVDSLTSLRRLVELNLGDEALLGRELSHLFASGKTG